MYASTLTSALALLLTTTTTAHPAAPLESRSGLTAAALLAIAPTSNTCSGAKYPTECRTATQALAPLLASFQTYQISDPATQAAVLSTIAFESGDFKYALHHFGASNPGQGTRNMQGPKFNSLYAQSLTDLPKDKVAAAQNDPVALVNLLISYADYDFGSGAWFLTSQCEKGVVEGLKNAGTAAFNAYLGCIGTAPTDDRAQYYQRALDALGVKSS